MSKDLFSAAKLHTVAAVSQRKNQQGHWQASIYSNKISLIDFHWVLSQSWIPMSKLSPLHNNFPLTALNEDFVMCIAAIMGSSKSTTHSASSSS